MSAADHQLLQFVLRIEQLNEENAAINAAKADVFAEAKHCGFDRAALREVIAIRAKRAKDSEAFEEKESLVELYLDAIEAAERDKPSRVQVHVHTRTRTRGTQDTAAPGTPPASPDPGQVDNGSDARSGGADGGIITGQSEQRSHETSGPGMSREVVDRGGITAAGEGGPPSSPARRSLADIAAGYEPTPVRRVVDEDEGIPPFLLRDADNRPAMEGAA